MKYQLLLKITIALISIVSASHVLAQNKVVVIPMFDTDVVFTGVGKTGDAKCSEFKDPPGNWQEVSCASLPDSLKGQDAELSVGAEVMPGFTINGGTVKDNLTGLIWLRDAFCAEQVLGNTWEEALGFIVELNTTGTMNLNPTGCGDFSNGGVFQTNWRLPNVKELQSLLYYEHDMGITDYPFLSDANGDGDHSDGDPFQNVRIDEAYWSSTNYGFQFDADLNVNLIDDVKQLIERVVNDLHAEITEKSIRLITQLDSEKQLTGNEELLYILLRNLIDNAIRYSPPSSEVLVRYQCAENTLRISVTDHGPGIICDKRERVFDRFYRDIDAQGSGSGLGLAIARQIASLHQADIVLGSAESGVGLSATVAFKQG